MSEETVILMYHRLGDGRLPGREPGEHRYAVSHATFEAQLAAIQESGCSPVSLETFAEADRGTRLPAKSLAITFDDGNESDRSVALELMARQKLPAAFFITPAWIATPGYMDWAGVRELLAAGMTVGAHGLDHSPLAALGDEELRSHLREARRVLEARLGRAPDWLALPGGAGGRREVRVAREVGFRHVLGSVPRLARVGVIDPIPRFAVRRGDSTGLLRGLIERRRGVRFRFWLRHRALTSLHSLLGAKDHARLRNAWLALDRDE